MKSHTELRSLYEAFWSESPRSHTNIGYSPLVLAEDATTLFNSSGMQPLVPYLSGETHPQGNRLFNIQPCIRTQDIEEVGDFSHTTFFEMFGNWSLGEYYKKEQIPWKWEFLTNVLKLPKEKLYVTVFEGNEMVPRDEEAADIWKKLGIEEDRIFYYGVKENWWSRSGPPDKMPEGEIGGPSTEVFYDFGRTHDVRFGKECHPNCDCGRFLEICNSVFIQYRKVSSQLEELPQKNVDFGGGLERMLAAWNDTDVFETDLFAPIIKEVEAMSGQSYSDQAMKSPIRVIVDHIRASVFLIKDGVRPANKEHGYVLRRLLRRSVVKMHELTGQIPTSFDSIIEKGVVTAYKGTDLLENANIQEIVETIHEEIKKFSKTLENGLSHINKLTDINAKAAFDLYQSYGFPFELTLEFAEKKNIHLSKEDFEKELEAHRNLSKTTSAGMFKGGLADESDAVIKYHTTTHLLHQALKDVFGDIVRQEGSNITQERLRFDVRLHDKPTDEEVKKVEAIINEKISASLPVHFEIMPRAEAEKLGASAFFKEKYGETVKVYFIGDYSKELCGGPHVAITSEIGSIAITKVKKIGTQLVRFYVE